MKASKNPQILRLYPNVIPVKGYNRSLLVDLLVGEPYLVPNGLVDYLSQAPATGFEEYEKFILENELGILVDQEIGECLTPLPLNYYPASKINNAILELDENSSWSIPSVLNQLNDLGTQFLEVRFLDHQSLLIHLPDIQKYTCATTIESIQIMTPFNENLKDFLNSALNERFFRLSTIVVYNSVSGFELNNHFYNLIFSSQKSVSHENCGNISPGSFSISTQAYIRNRNSNSCLAHKISVDKAGFVCNCPSLGSKYGHVDSATLIEALSMKEFQNNWDLTKDKILVCSICEFRWICNDCRAFTTQNLENGKPSKCNYNPFISLWEGEENYLPETACGVSFENNELNIDEEKLNRINERIWG